LVTQLFDQHLISLRTGLFDYNPNLEFVGFWESKIIHIDPNVFDHLYKLSNFWLGEVLCINIDFYDSKEQVKKAINIVKSKCSKSEFLALDNQIKNLEIESKYLNSEVFGAKLQSFEKNFNNSKFSKSQTLNYKFQNLKSALNTT